MQNFSTIFLALFHQHMDSDSLLCIAISTALLEVPWKNKINTPYQMLLVRPNKINLIVSGQACRRQYSICHYKQPSLLSLPSISKEQHHHHHQQQQHGLFAPSLLSHTCMFKRLLCSAEKAFLGCMYL